MKAILLSLIGFILISATNSNVTELKELKKSAEGLYMHNNAVFSGKVLAKHKNGTVGLVGEIKDGLKDGTWTYWYSSGEKKRESVYVKNKKQGLTYYWYMNGQVAKEIMYRDDKNIDQKLWDEDGNRLKNPSFNSFQ